MGSRHDVRLEDGRECEDNFELHAARREMAVMDEAEKADFIEDYNRSTLVAHFGGVTYFLIFVLSIWSTFNVVFVPNFNFNLILTTSFLLIHFCFFGFFFLYFPRYTELVCPKCHANLLEYKPHDTNVVAIHVECTKCGEDCTEKFHIKKRLSCL